MTEPQPDQSQDYAWVLLREQRNRLLAESDWTQAGDSVVDRDSWATYRQALRDLPAHTGNPWTPDWPAPPTDDPTSADARAAEAANLRAAVVLALDTNAADLAEDDTVRTQALGIANNPATNLTTQQIVTVLKQLAQGLAILATHDATAKKELTELVKLLLGRFARP